MDHDNKSQISQDPSVLPEEEIDAKIEARNQTQEAIENSVNTLTRERSESSSSVSSTNTEKLLKMAEDGGFADHKIGSTTTSRPESPKDHNRSIDSNKAAVFAMLNNESEHLEAPSIEHDIRGNDSEAHQDDDRTPRASPIPFTQTHASQASLLDSKIDDTVMRNDSPNPQSEFSEMSKISDDFLKNNSTTSEASSTGSTELDRSMNFLKENPDNVMFHSFRSILANEHQFHGDDSKHDVFTLLDLTQLLDQKGQLHVLNNSLQKYMNDNKSMDDDIRELANKIKALDNKEKEDNKQTVNETLRKISEEKTQVLEQNDIIKNIKIQNDRLGLKNKNLIEDCEETEEEIEYLRKKIQRIDEKLQRVNQEIEDSQRCLDEAKPEQVRLDKAYTELKDNNKKKLTKLIVARKRAGCDELEEMAHKRDPGLDKVLAEYRKKVCENKDSILKKDVNELKKEVQLQKDEFERITEAMRDLDKMNDNLTHEHFEIESSCKWVEMQVREANERLLENEERHGKDLARLDAKMGYLENAHETHQAELLNAYKYLKMVLLQEAGEKERLDVELQSMARMLSMADQNAVKEIAERRRSLRSSRSSSGSSSSGRSRNSRFSRNSMKGDHRVVL